MRWTRKFTRIGGRDTRIREIIETEPGKFVLVANNGIWEFDLEAESFEKRPFIDRTGQEIGERGAIRLLIDHQGRYWISTDIGRLYCFDHDRQEVAFSVDGTPIQDLKLNRFRKSLQDKDGIIWATPFQNGLLALTPGSLDFKQIESDLNEFRTVQETTVFSIHELSNGSLCFGTQNSGIFMLDSNRLPIDLYTYGSRTGNLALRNIRNIARNPDGTFWVTNSRGSVQRFNPGDRSFSPPLSNIENLEELKGRAIASVASDGQGSLYALTNKSCPKDRYGFEPDRRARDRLGRVRD